jgi:hypothetical protein
MNKTSNFKKHTAVLLAMALLWGSASGGGIQQTKTFVFEKRQGIAAAPSKIFSLLANFKDYPRLFPESHSEVTIVSLQPEGKGVVFDNVAAYGKSRTVKNRWTVTEFARERVIRLDSDTAGTVIVMLHQVDYDTTEETLIASVNVLPKFKDEVFAAYDKEMSDLKAACEQPADSTKKK